MNAQDLAAELQKPWRHGEHLDARGVVLNEPLVLDGMTIRGFDMSGAHLKAGFSARGTKFRGLGWLRGVKIDGDLDLTGGSFQIDLRAEDISANKLILDDVQVRGVIALARAHARRLSLINALVLANLTLEEAEISDFVDLSGAEIMGGYWADGARLGKFIAEGCDLHGRRHNWAGAPA